jgi:hypothetical protein
MGIGGRGSVVFTGVVGLSACVEAGDTLHWTSLGGGVGSALLTQHVTVCVVRVPGRVQLAVDFTKQGFYVLGLAVCEKDKQFRVLGFSCADSSK